MAVIRGNVVPLTADQRVTRMRYLAGLAPLRDLDPHVRRDGAPSECPALYYLLKDHNGGKDPTAPDPADRWSSAAEVARYHNELGRELLGGPPPKGMFVNRTVDCIGGQAWCGGWDRYQPKRFAHIYEGWINTDSMIEDARGPQRCFVPITRPTPGDMVVCASGSRGHRIGHIGGIIAVPAEWDPRVRECWTAIEVVDVAARTGRANSRTTAAGWYDTGALFVRSVMA